MSTNAFTVRPFPDGKNAYRSGGVGPGAAKPKPTSARQPHKAAIRPPSTAMRRGRCTRHQTPASSHDARWSLSCLTSWTGCTYARWGFRHRRVLERWLTPVDAPEGLWWLMFSPSKWAGERWPERRAAANRGEKARHGQRSAERRRGVLGDAGRMLDRSAGGRKGAGGRCRRRAAPASLAAACRSPSASIRRQAISCRHRSSPGQGRPPAFDGSPAPLDAAGPYGEGRQARLLVAGQVVALAGVDRGLGRSSRTAFDPGTRSGAELGDRTAAGARAGPRRP